MGRYQDLQVGDSLSKVRLAKMMLAPQLLRFVKMFVRYAYRLRDHENAQKEMALPCPLQFHAATGERCSLSRLRR